MATYPNLPFLLMVDFPIRWSAVTLAEYLINVESTLILAVLPFFVVKISKSPLQLRNYSLSKPSLLHAVL